jgi:hypothetical protein
MRSERRAFNRRRLLKTEHCPHPISCAHGRLGCSPQLAQKRNKRFRTFGGRGGKVEQHRLKIKIGVVAIGLALALAPAAPAWAGSHKTKAHHKKHHAKHTVKSSSALICPSAAALGTAGGTTYTAPQSQPGGNPGTIVCQYSAGGEVALLVSLYPKGTSLREISANVPAATKKISGLGNSASHFGTEVYVANSSSPSFSVIDQTGSLTLAQVEAEARAVLAG